MIILVDTREQKPYWSGIACARLKLNVGDYSTHVLLNKVHIERKSAIDWYGTISSNSYLRFRKEILRARDAKIRLVVLVESTEKDFYAKNFPRGDRLKRSGKSLRKHVNTLTNRYGLEIIWSKDRETAKRKCYEILSKASRTERG